MEKKINNTHGGKRKGSGRKRKDTTNIILSLDTSLHLSLLNIMTSQQRNKKIREFLKTLI